MGWGSLAFCQLKWLIPSRQGDWRVGVGWGCLVNGARLRKIAAWHLSLKHSKRLRTHRRESWGDRVRCRGCSHKALIPWVDLGVYWRRGWGSRGRKEEESGWMEERRMKKSDRAFLRMGNKQRLLWKLSYHAPICVPPPFPQIHSNICVLILIKIWSRMWV